MSQEVTPVGDCNNVLEKCSAGCFVLRVVRIVLVVLVVLVVVIFVVIHAMRMHTSGASRWIQVPLEDSVCITDCLKLFSSIGIVGIFVWMSAQRMLNIILLE